MTCADLLAFLVSPTASLADAMRCLERNAKGIALVVDDAQQLLGTISDGDARRALLEGATMQTPIGDLLRRKEGTLYSKPLTAPVGTGTDVLRKLMTERGIRQVPIVDAAGRVVDLSTWEDFLPVEEGPVQAVVMAGGQGQRLRPLTNHLPKPMLPILDRPILEHVVERLRDSGIGRICISTGYRSEVIREYFGDGKQLGVAVDYITESKPLGTAGALACVTSDEGPILVVNGDVLTDLDYRQLVAFHRENHAALTMAVRRYEISIPYGVVECEGVAVAGVGEKPTLGFFVNAGIYLVERENLAVIPQGERYDMVDLVQTLIDQKRRVVAFPVHEYWIDVGEHEKYEQAQVDARNGRFGR